MLKNLDPILNADLLHVLRSMGHGDEVALVDCNFPAASVAAATVSGKLVQLDGVDIPAAARAILSVFPLDSFVDEPVLRMEVVGAAEQIVPCHRDMQTVIEATSARPTRMGRLERHAFYARARRAFAVVCAAGERRPYGCFMLVKGVIGPDGQVV